MHINQLHIWRTGRDSNSTPRVLLCRAVRQRPLKSMTYEIQRHTETHDTGPNTGLTGPNTGLENRESLEEANNLTTTGDRNEHN